MELYSDMKFEIQSCFIPNLSHSDTLKILEVTPNSVVIQMNKTNSRGVFPSDNFQYWIKKGSLIYLNENQKRTS